jgi:energy-coupling factor transporter ATP-binding protein EcfA2
MDEPSRGIDVGAKAEVFREMRKLAAEGLGILFVTSDLEEVMSLSDRILVMSNGKITGEFATGTADEAAIVAASAVGRPYAGPGGGGGMISPPLPARGRVGMPSKHEESHLGRLPPVSGSVLPARCKPEETP